jgi:hypothetical protein
MVVRGAGVNVNVKLITDPRPVIVKTSVVGTLTAGKFEFVGSTSLGSRFHLEQPTSNKQQPTRIVVRKDVLA